MELPSQIDMMWHHPYQMDRRPGEIRRIPHNPQDVKYLASIYFDSRWPTEIKPTGNYTRFVLPNGEIYPPNGEEWPAWNAKCAGKVIHQYTRGIRSELHAVGLFLYHGFPDPEDPDPEDFFDPEQLNVTLPDSYLKKEFKFYNTGKVMARTPIQAAFEAWLMNSCSTLKMVNGDPSNRFRPQQNLLYQLLFRDDIWPIIMMHVNFSTVLGFNPFKESGETDQAISRKCMTLRHFNLWDDQIDLPRVVNTDGRDRVVTDTWFRRRPQFLFPNVPPNHLFVLDLESHEQDSTFTAYYAIMYETSKKFIKVSGANSSMLEQRAIRHFLKEQVDIPIEYACEKVFNFDTMEMDYLPFTVSIHELRPAFLMIPMTPVTNEGPYFRTQKIWCKIIKESDFPDPRPHAMHETFAVCFDYRDEMPHNRVKVLKRTDYIHFYLGPGF